MLKTKSYTAGRKAWAGGAPATPPSDWDFDHQAYWAWGWLDAQQRFNAQFPVGDAKRDRALLRTIEANDI